MTAQLLTDGEEHPLPDYLREDFELIARSQSRSDWGLAGDPVASIARIGRFAVLGVRVKGEADSDWFLTARIHPAKGRRISVRALCRI